MNNEMNTYNLINNEGVLPIPYIHVLSIHNPSTLNNNVEPIINNISTHIINNILETEPEPQSEEPQTEEPQSEEPQSEEPQSEEPQLQSEQQLKKENDFIPGMFYYVKDNSSREMLQNAWASITQVDLWEYMKLDTDSYMFSNHPEVGIITKKMEELGYNGHSGSTFGWTMRQMQYIAKYGETKYMNETKIYNETKKYT